MRKSLINLFIIVVIVISSNSALAQFNFSPSLLIREEYNDNIFLTDTDEKHDFITTVNPALTFGYSSTQLNLSLDYGLNFIFYADNSKENQTSLDQTQRVTASVSLVPIRDVLFINATDVYHRVTIDQRRQTAADNLLANLTDSNRFIFDPYLELPRSGSLKLRVGASYEDLWYREDEGDDAKNYTAKASITKTFAERHSLGLSYSYLFHRPQNTPDYDRQNASLNLALRNEEGISFEGSVGGTSLNYMNSAQKDTSSLVWSVRLRQGGSSRVGMDAGYSEDFSDSVNQGVLRRKSADLNVRYAGYSTLTAGGFWTREKYEFVDREDRSFGAKAGISIPLSSRLSARLNGSYTRYKFLPEQEKANRYSAQGSIEYLLRHLALTVGYTYNLNDSNFAVNNYTNNIAYIQAKLTF